MGHLNKDILVVIPARKGSKRLPGKNSMPLAGKPLIAHSIDYAQNTLPTPTLWCQPTTLP